MLEARFRAVLGLACLVVGCAAGSDREGFSEKAAATEPPPDGGPSATGQFTQDPDAASAPPPDQEVREVYGQSKTTLYKLDPVTNAVTVVGDFNGCAAINDIALDEKSTLYAASYDTLYTVDKKTAACTKVASGSYPNSLSFVPKGTLDPNAEALVGYGGDKGDEYLRIDVKTGKSTTIGKLGNNLVSSGDITSVKGGATYLTVKGGSCSTTDCLVEVDPQTGAMVKNWGSIEHKNVFGLSFWGGKVYGFDDSGELFEVTFGTSHIVTTEIAIPNKPAKLSFWGAGSSTSAPLTPTVQ
jgi:hypothetical protein